MKKINPSDGFLHFNPLSKGRDGDEKKTGKTGKTGFLSLFSKKTDKDEKVDGVNHLHEYDGEALDALLDAIHESGDVLKETGTYTSLLEYKSSVRKFMSFIVDSTVDVEEQLSGHNIMKRKKFTLINVINAKLDKLAAEILASQKDLLGVLERVDEINGLLIDLMS